MCFRHMGSARARHFIQNWCSSLFVIVYLFLSVKQDIEAIILYTMTVLPTSELSFVRSIFMEIGHFFIGVTFWLLFL